MSETYDPILETAKLRRLRVGAPLRTPAIGTTMVLERATGAPLVVHHGERVPDARTGNYRRMHLVDTGTHGLAFTTKVPSADPAFPFVVTVNVACQITDPVIIARDNVRNMTAAFSPSLTTIMRGVSVRFDVWDSAAAEAAITARLNSTHSHRAVLLTGFVATVEPADTADIVTARRELRVLGIRRDAMRPVAHSSREEMLAHYMALDGGDPKELLDREQKDREMHTNASLAALAMLMGSEKLEEFDTSRVSAKTMETFFPGEDSPTLKRGGIKDRLDRKRRGELPAGGPVVEEGASAPRREADRDKPAPADGGAKDSPGGQRPSRVRGTARSSEDS